MWCSLDQLLKAFHRLKGASMVEFKTLKKTLKELCRPNLGLHRAAGISKWADGCYVVCMCPDRQLLRARAENRHASMPVLFPGRLSPTCAELPRLLGCSLQSMKAPDKARLARSLQAVHRLRLV